MKNMQGISTLRGEIHIYFHDNDSIQEFFFKDDLRERYAAYYTSMYLLADSTESLLKHYKKGFNPNEFLAYIEIWGVMQAVIIQQDSIKELYEAITNNSFKNKFKTENIENWFKFRELRNICAGHPAKKNLPKGSPTIRAFMGRNFGNYSEFSYEQFNYEQYKILKKTEKKTKTKPNYFAGISHPKVNLEKLLDEYAFEAKGILEEIFDYIKINWPNK